MKKNIVLNISIILVLLALSNTVQAQELTKKNASEILEIIEKGDDINLENFYITGYFNLSDIKLENTTNIWSEWIEPDTGLVIYKNLRIVKSQISITNSIFENDVCFTNIYFEKPLNFQGTSFNGNADFSFANFNSYSNFGGTNFNKNAKFVYATFSESTAFYGSYFNNGANFIEAKFKNDVDFSNAIFDGSVSFWNAKFRVAIFYNVNFNGYTDFISSNVSTSNLMVSGTILIQKATLEADC